MGFLAKPLPFYGRDVIECPACSRPVRTSPLPAPNGSEDKSLYICRCGWESKFARPWKRVIANRRRKDSI